MRFRIYILLAAAFLWFTFASVFMYRSTWDIEDAKFHKNILVEFGMREQNQSNLAGIMFFKLQGLETTMGIYKKRYKDYDSLLNHLKIGDTLSVYFEDWKHEKGSINTQVVHLENDKMILVNYVDRKRRDLLIAVILYFICSIFLGAAWLLNQKRLRIIRMKGNEFYGLGVY